MSESENILKKHVTISIDAAIHRAAKQYVSEKGYDFSELVARLINAELASKTGIARRFKAKAAA
jgi:hypothetical protein